MLSKAIANDIVQETSMRLNRNINIMNNQGIIIAARDASRIGSIHEGALEVLRTEKELIIRSDKKDSWKGAQPGINLPIIFQEEILGVIGITGDPGEVWDLGGLVKMTTELMIKQRFITSQTEWKQRTKEMVIEQLLKKEPDYNHMKRGLGLLDLQLTPPFMSIVIQMSERTVPNQTLIRELETSIGKVNGITGFININSLFIAFTGLKEEEAHNTLQKIYYLLKKLHVDFRMAYSFLFDEIEKFHQSFLDCNLTLKISSGRNDFVSFADIEAKALIYQIEATQAKAFSKRIMAYMDESDLETLELFFKNDLNIQKASEALHMHRNTLIYRL